MGLTPITNINNDMDSYDQNVTKNIKCIVLIYQQMDKEMWLPNFLLLWKQIFSTPWRGWSKWYWQWPLRIIFNQYNIHMWALIHLYLSFEELWPDVHSLLANAHVFVTDRITKLFSKLNHFYVSQCPSQIHIQPFLCKQKLMMPNSIIFYYIQRQCPFFLMKYGLFILRKLLWTTHGVNINYPSSRWKL